MALTHTLKKLGPLQFGGLCRRTGHRCTGPIPATDHVTGELHKLQIRDKYYGGEQIYTANGANMDISHIGRTTVPTPIRDIHLNNVLYIPKTP